MGSKGLNDAFWTSLTTAGGKAAAFNPVSPFTQLRRRDRVDFRNHRKNVIIDGRIGFTGGINIGREYLGLDPEVGRWRDTHLRITGPAALSLQRVFARDWRSAVDEKIDVARWFPAPEENNSGDSIVQIVDSGPDSEWSAVEEITFAAINAATTRVWLATPYFVPSPGIEFALVNAAMRGVDVEILLPEKADSHIVGLASRSYFGPLLRAGVKLHLYQRGFMHAKTLVVDDWMGTVGSANIDMRSFRLNFELNAFVYDPPFVGEMAAQFVRDLNNAKPFTLENESRIRVLRRLSQQAARLLSPLL
jgi:cardiolipin synthase